MKNSRLKILFLVPTFPVMSETFIEREILELKRRNAFDVSVITFKKGTHTNYPELFDSTTEFKIVAKDIVLGNLYFLQKNPKGLFKSFFIALKNSRGLLTNIYIWLKSLGYGYKLSKVEFDHIHAHFFSQSSTIAFFAANLLNKSFSLSGHAKDIFDHAIKSDSKPELIRDKVHYSTFAALCNKKALEACKSHILKDDIKKVHLLYHGVDLSNDALVNSSNPDARLYFVGRFVQKKGLIYLLEALKIIKDQGLQFRMIIAGYGPDYSFLKNFVLSNGLVKYVEFINENHGIDYATSLNYMRHADIVVVPAVNLADGDSDGIPNIILEAGMLSKPVITTDAGSILEVVQPGVNAVVVKQKDERELAVEIVNLLGDREKQVRLATNLHQVVIDRFNLSKNIIDLEKLLLG